jgi:hypothetical protein
MNLINFIVWLSAGAVIGWFASRMEMVEHKRTHKPCLARIAALRRVNPLGVPACHNGSRNVCTHKKT